MSNILEYDSLRGAAAVLASASSPSLIGEGASRSLPLFTTLVSRVGPWGRWVLDQVDGLTVLGGGASLRGMQAPPGVQLCSRTRAACCTDAFMAVPPGDMPLLTHTHLSRGHLTTAVMLIWHICQCDAAEYECTLHKRLHGSSRRAITARVQAYHSLLTPANSSNEPDADLTHMSI